jgi:hypothetical protein
MLSLITFYLWVGRHIESTVSDVVFAEGVVVKVGRLAEYECGLIDETGVVYPILDSQSGSEHLFSFFAFRL